MNLYIMTDIEGISGIYCPDQVSASGSRFQEGRRYMTDEVNACVHACKEAGADTIYVRDAHSASYSLIWDQLTPEADYYICGRTETERFAGIDDCDAVILLGYHAMAGTRAAVLEHSMSSASIQNYWINGQAAGETAIDAGIAGEHGKPVILVTGDDRVCAEARALLPHVTTAEVKKGLTSFGSMLLPPAKARRILKEQTFQAVRGAASMPPFTFPGPICLRVEMTERSQLPLAIGKPYFTRIDGRTYEITAPTLEEAFFLSL